MSTLAERQIYFQEANRWFIETMIGFASQNKTNLGNLQAYKRSLLSALEQAFDKQMVDLFVQGTFMLASFWEFSGEFDIASAFHERAVSIAPSEETSARALFNYSYISEKRGDYNKSLSLCEEGLELARKNDNKILIVDLIWQLSRMQARFGNFEQAETLINEGLTLAEKIGYRKRMGSLLNVAGYLADYFRANYDQANAHYERGIHIATLLDDKELLGDLYLNLAIINIRIGSYVLAISQLEKALTFSKEIGHREQICYILQNLASATVNLSRDNMTQAITYVEEAMEIAREIGHLELLTMTYMNGGTLAIEDKRFELATSYFQKAYASVYELGNVTLIGAVLTEYGKLFLAMKQWGQAWELNNEALTFTRSSNLPEFEGKALFGLAQAAAGQGHLDKARKFGNESLALFQRIANEHADEVGEWLSSLAYVP